MPSPRSRQQFLDLGERAHFDLLHGAHRANVAFATGKRPNWREHGAHPHDEAVALALTMQGWSDAYLSQNGFDGKRRDLEQVSALTTCFADLDVYNIAALSGLTVDDLLDRMQAAHPWLPLPTMIVSSGRGFYVNWILRSPLAHDRLPRWQAVNDALIAALSDVGADAHAKDATRVLRIVGSVNSRNGATVTAWETGDSIAFEQLERLVLTHALPAKPRLVLVANNADLHSIEQRVSTATPAQRRQYLVAYQLAHDRMADYATIARLRGSPRVRDYRHRLLYCLAVSGAWFWSDVEQAERELLTFARSHFADATRYKVRTMQTVLDRMEQGMQGKVRVLFNGASHDPRYRMRNATIIATLDLSPGEQRELKTIIDKPERENRRAARRREAGMTCYAERTTKRLQAILAGLDRGLTHKAIAEQLGITRQAVGVLLKRQEHRQDGNGGDLC